MHISKGSVDRTSLEKSRLIQRDFGFIREHPSSISPLEHQQSEPPIASFNPLPFSQIAAEEKSKHLQRESNRINHLSQSRKLRETSKWSQFESEQQVIESKWKELTGKSRRNLSSVGYDLVSLEYRNNLSAEAVQAKAKEEAIARGVESRTQKIALRMHSNGLNPITGEPAYK